MAEPRIERIEMCWPAWVRTSRSTSPEKMTCERRRGGRQRRGGEKAFDRVRRHLEIKDETSSTGLLALEANGDEDLAAERKEAGREQQEERMPRRRKDGPDLEDNHATARIEERFSGKPSAEASG